MENITKPIRVVLSFIIIGSALIAPPFANAFQEGWESSPIGMYLPDHLPLPLIPADEGDWILGDTVSEFPECGSTPHTAEILLSGGNRSLRLTSNDSSSDCADNVWVHIVEVPPLNLNPGFSVPLTSGTIISFEETGNLTSPEAGSHYCVNPPCGDTVSLTLEDNSGNMLAYVLQRAPGALPNEVHSFYREVFLDPNAGAHSRNLFADFNTIPDFNPSGATIRQVVFEVDEHGTATIDNICIGTSGCAPSGPNVTEVIGDERANAVVTMGTVVTGGDQMALAMNFPAYEAAVDIYAAVQLPDGSLYLVKSDGSLTMDLVPYRTGVTEAQSATILDAFDVCTSSGASVPTGTWNVYSVVVPTNDGDFSAIDFTNGDYNLWFYSFDVTCP